MIDTIFLCVVVFLIGVLVGSAKKNNGKNERKNDEFFY